MSKGNLTSAIGRESMWLPPSGCEAQTSHSMATASFTTAALLKGTACAVQRLGCFPYCLRAGSSECTVDTSQAQLHQGNSSTCCNIQA